MSDPGTRPDPDALLRRMQQAEERAKRGKLKSFFGFAPGVSGQRGSGDIDVHVSSGTPDDAEPRGSRRPRARAPFRHYASAALLVGATLGAASVLQRLMDLPDLEMLFLLSVMVTAVWFGRGPSVLAAALGVASYDFFFVPPLHTFSVDDRRYFLTFAMMFGVGFVISELAGRLRQQERDATSREERTTLLYALTRELAGTDEPNRIAAIAARHAAALLGARAVVLTASAEGILRSLGAAPEHASIDANELSVAKWCYEHGELAGLGTDTLPGSQVLCAPLRAGHARLGVLALVPTERAALRTEQRAFLDVFCRQVAVALERARLSDEANEAALRAKTEEMRSSLLSAVSHDLRTPLASITGAATSLRDDVDLPEETRGELVEAIVDQAERLERLVANLLDMTRLESGGVALKKDWVPLEEMIGSALTRLETRLDARQITVDIPADVPLVLVDPVLFEQIFVNLLENADKYTPPRSAIEIRAWRESERVAIDVSDHGPGLPLGAESKVFEKFFRAANAGNSGAGLGLAICKGIVEAHGGSIWVENRQGGGATFHLAIPNGGTPPALSPSGANA